MTTWAELERSLGAAACAASDELAAAAPLLSEQTYAQLAVLMRREQPAPRFGSAEPDAA